MRDKEYQPWHRFISKGESQPAHDLFLIYASLGAKRSSPGQGLALVAEETGRRIELVKRLSIQFHWTRRARAYDNHIRKIREKAIENLSAQEALIFKEREIEYREDCYQLSERLRRRIDEMLTFPLHRTVVKETVPMTFNGETIEVEHVVVHEPVKWSMKDLYAMAEVQDKMHRMAFNAPTSRVAVSVTPQLTLEERIEQARAKMDFYIKNKLEKAVQRIWEKDMAQNPSEIRQSILDELPVWCAEDFQIQDPLLLTAGELEPKALSLEDEEPQEVGGVN